MINIICTIDNNYVQHCGVMICSVLSNIKDEEVHFTIINNGLESSLKNQLKKIIHDFQQHVSFLKVDEDQLKGAMVSCHVSLATYYRLLIPELIDDTIDKVLFLDSDIIVRANINELWNINIDNSTHAAAVNPNISPGFKANLGIAADNSYFNAGVMLINLKAWRELEITIKAIDFINQYPERITFWDQDVLNYLLYQSWTKLEPIWNAQEAIFNNNFTAEELGYKKDEYNQARNNPRIVHFTGAGYCKPWYYHCQHPFKQEYYAYLKKTPWRNFRPLGEPSLKSKLKSKAISYFALLKNNFITINKK